MLYPRKGTQTLRRGAVDGCAYSFIDKNGVDYFNGVAVPTVTGNTRAQLFSAFENLQAALEELDFDCVVKLEVFLRNIGDKELVRAIMQKVWGEKTLMPATTFVAQAPCDDQYNVTLLAVAVNSSSSSPNSMPISVSECGERASLLEYDGVSIGFFGGFTPGCSPVGAYERSFDAFAKMRSEVEGAGFLFPQVFRTWLYQGNITLEEGETQRYKELNRARSDFFYGTRFLEERLPKGVQFGPIYPASTGISADDVDVAMGCLAIKTNREDVVLAPLENPNQTPAFDYAEFYSPKSPKFSRAMAVSFNERASVFVSGTASIVDQKTVHIGDVAAQTHQTLDNIEALISGENIAKYGIPGFDATLADLAVARVYVKLLGDYPAVREICEKRLPDVPLVYTYAGVCRDDLLVEIEGVASCKQV
ncbi:MAG: dioxygenase [Thermoguttaceae bacterium]|jgi:enamine deaminase RidA (YjgF/YER057c/UK114 family)